MLAQQSSIAKKYLFECHTYLHRVSREKSSARAAVTRRPASNGPCTTDSSVYSSPSNVIAVTIAAGLEPLAALTHTRKTSRPPERQGETSTFSIIEKSLAASASANRARPAHPPKAGSSLNTASGPCGLRPPCAPQAQLCMNAGRHPNTRMTAFAAGASKLHVCANTT